MTRGSSGGGMDSGFVFKLGRLFRTSYGGDGVDFVDQLNYQYTGGLMMIFITIIGLRQYVGECYFSAVFLFFLLVLRSLCRVPHRKTRSVRS